MVRKDLVTCVHEGQERLTPGQGALAACQGNGTSELWLSRVRNGALLLLQLLLLL